MRGPNACVRMQAKSQRMRLPRGRSLVSWIRVVRKCTVPVSSRSNEGLRVRWGLVGGRCSVSAKFCAKQEEVQGCRPVTSR